MKNFIGQRSRVLVRFLWQRVFWGWWKGRLVAERKKVGFFFKFTILLGI